MLIITKLTQVCLQKLQGLMGREVKLLAQVQTGFLWDSHKQNPDLHISYLFFKHKGTVLNKARTGNFGEI